MDITLKYMSQTPLRDLSTCSSTYPFSLDGKKYASVEHYVFDKLLGETFTSEILSKRDTRHLRQTFNDHVDHVLLTTTRDTLRALLSHPPQHLQALLETYTGYYFYYIQDDNTLWGIDSSGFGYNLLGQVYSRILDPTTFPVCGVKECYPIYKASVLLTRHFQEAVKDIRPFIGMSVHAILDALTPLFPETSFLSEDHVMQMYVKDPFSFCIQYELDYPMNLAGFIRQRLARHFNTYIRRTFHELMIRQYFLHVLHTHFPSYHDDCVKQQMGRLSDDGFRRMAQMLYTAYNDPDTHESTFAFLPQSVRDQLYGLEMSMLSPDEIEEAVHYVPFLYHVKVGRSVYIYDHIDGDYFIQPAETRLSPLFLTLGDLTVAQSCFSRLLVTLCGQRHEDALSAVRTIQSMSQLQHVFAMATRQYKKKLIVKATYKKFEHPFARYLLYTTMGRKIVVEDPDTVFEETTPPVLEKIRQTLDTPLYRVVSMFSSDVHIQDRVRFRLEDFTTVLGAYSSLLGRKLTSSDFDALERDIYRDPPELLTLPSSSLKGPDELAMFFETCDTGCQRRLSAFFTTYARLLEEHTTDLAPVSPSSSLAPIASIVSYFALKYLTPSREKEFFDFAFTAITGKVPLDVYWGTTQAALLAYYSQGVEEQFQKYISLDTYSKETALSLFNLTSRVQKHLSKTRWSWLSRVCVVQPSPTPYPSSLGKTVVTTLFVSSSKEKPEKKKTSLKKIVPNKDTSSGQPLVTDDDQHQEGKDYIHSLYEEMGLDDDSEEDTEEGASSSDEDESNE
jgi:predicted NAD-dependent protein-ADP-ribosyltransferase YbiA (DUF1768 family)